MNKIYRKCDDDDDDDDDDDEKVLHSLISKLHAFI